MGPQHTWDCAEASQGSRKPRGNPEETGWGQRRQPPAGVPKAAGSGACRGSPDHALVSRVPSTPQPGGPARPSRAEAVGNLSSCPWGLSSPSKPRDSSPLPSSEALSLGLCCRLVGTGGTAPVSTRTRSWTTPAPLSPATFYFGAPSSLANANPLMILTCPRHSSLRDPKSDHVLCSKPSHGKLLSRANCQIVILQFIC